MARDVSQALDLTYHILSAYESARPHLMLPVLSRAWLGVHIDTLALESTEDNADDTTVVSNAALLTEQEKAHGVSERTQPFFSNMQQTNGFPRQQPAILLVLRFLHVFHLWSSMPMLRVRLIVSNLAKSVKHSQHLRHGFKNAAGVALLSLPAFLPPGSPGNRWFYFAKGQWMVVSYVWVLETNTGATYQIGYLRLVCAQLFDLVAIEDLFILILSRLVPLLGSCMPT
jgi:hypothetical protein